MKDDAISRAAAIDVLSLGKEILSRALDDMDVVGTDIEKYSWGLRLIESDIEDIKELPSVQPERKTGKWIGHKLSGGLESIDEDTCSECGQRFYQIAETGCLWNYCPNCGAKMEGKPNEQNS